MDHILTCTISQKKNAKKPNRPNLAPLQCAALAWQVLQEGIRGAVLSTSSAMVVSPACAVVVSCGAAGMGPDSKRESMVLVAPIGGHCPGTMVKESVMDAEQARHVLLALKLLAKQWVNMCSSFMCLGLWAEALARTHCCCRFAGWLTTFCLPGAVAGVAGGRAEHE